MKSVLEIIMVAMLDSAMLILLLNTLKRPCTEKKNSRFVSVAFAVGFALGIVGKCLEKCSIAAIILYALGFMLAYTVFLFTFPEKRKRNENR